MGSRYACWSLGLCVAVAGACGRIGFDPLDVSADGGLHGSNASSRDAAAVDAIATDAAASGDGADGSGQTADSGAQGVRSTEAEASLTDAGTGVTGTVSVTDPALWALTGVAQFGSGELDLTTATRNTAGAAYLPERYAIGPTTSFAVSFSFRLTGGSGQVGDGFAFIWQNDPRGTGAIGGNGGSLGYSGITPSVEVEFDIQQNSYDPAPNDVAITTDGQNMTAIAHSVAPFMMADGTTHYAWIDYQGATQTLSVFLANGATQPATPLVSATVDLYTTVGSSAYIGFTGSCGVSTETNAIESLSIQYSP